MIQKNIIMKLKVVLAVVLLTSSLQSQAQFGDLIKNKLSKKKTENSNDSKEYSETKITNFIFFLTFNSVLLL